MPNAHRGETVFRALGREMFLVYGTREIAEAWTALGFRRPDPLAPATHEDVSVEEVYEEEPGKTAKRVVVRRVLVDFAARYERIKDAFDTVFLNPDPEALRKCIAIGLRRCLASNPETVLLEGGRWEKRSGLSDQQFDELCEQLTYSGLHALHVSTYLNCLRATPQADEGDEAGGRDPNAPGAVSASSTSSTS